MKKILNFLIVILVLCSFVLETNTYALTSEAVEVGDGVIS